MLLRLQFVLLSFFLLGLPAHAGLLEQGSTVEFVDSSNMGELAVTFDMGFRNWQVDTNTSLSRRSLSRAQAIQLQSELQEYDFSRSGGGITESYSMQETRWEFRPSLGFKLDRQWKFLITANIVSSNYAFDRQILGVPSVYATRAFDQSFRQSGIKPPVDQRRTHWQSLEIISQYDLHQSPVQAYSVVTSVEVPMSDQVNEYSIVNSDPNESQLDVELGVMAQNRFISSRVKQGIYLYYRAQLESDASVWSQSPSGSGELISEQTSRDVGDRLGIELSHRIQVGSRWALRAAFAYVQQYRDKIKNYKPVFESLMSEGREFRNLSIESIWSIGAQGLNANVRLAQPLESANDQRPTYSMGISKVF